MQVLKRNLGFVRELDGGEWTSDPNVHKQGRMITIYICCPLCESVDDSLEAQHVGKDGTVRYVWECPKCPAREFIKLDTWGEVQFDTSDIEKERPR